MPDPWAEFHLEDVETEHATRYRSVALPALGADIKYDCWFVQGLSLCSAEYLAEELP